MSQALAAAARRAEARLGRMSGRAFTAGLFAAACVVGLACVPGYRWAGAVSGDEPKYLRMAASLAHDLDADVSSDAAGPLTLKRLGGGLGAMAAAAANAVATLGDETVPPAGGWSRGNWTVAGRHGGEYQVQPPGLAVLLAAPLALEERLLGERPDHPLLTLFLVAVWALAFAQTALFGAVASGHRLAGVVAAALACGSTPVFIGGLHFYPETLAVAAAPWLALTVAGPAPPRLLRAVAAALVAGSLAWLHPKFVLLGVAALALLAVRLRAQPRRLAAVAAAWAVPVLALLLYCQHVTGLLRPDALYVRYGSDIYSGAADLLRVRTVIGLLYAFFAARDGLFLLAPVLATGVFAATTYWRRERWMAIVAGGLFCGTWLAAATHQGAAPGPPGRLLAPAAWALAAAMAAGLSAHPRRAAFAWCVAILGLATLTITVAVGREWRRTVNPYRGLAAEVNPGRDLPDHPRPRGEHVFGPAYEIGKSALLAVLVLAGAAALGRGGPARPGAGGAPDGWPAVRNVHLALWAALALAAYGLRALAPS